MASKVWFTKELFKMKFTIETKKSKEEVLNIIQENTSEHRNIFLKDIKDYSENFNGEFFNGNVYSDSFSLHRNSTAKKSIIPLILGTVEETDSGAIVKIKMRLDLSVIIFLFFWFSFVLIACMDSLNIIPLLMLIAGILMITIPTKKEIKKAKEKLEELLKD